MISVKKISTPKEMKEFVKFPFSLYKNSKTWVPPIIKDELATLDVKKIQLLKMQKLSFFGL